MDKNKTLIFGLLTVVAMLVWGWSSSGVTNSLIADADMLQIYLVNKGVFAAVLLVAMCILGGLKSYGIVGRSSLWFVVPGLPFILLTILVLLNPEAPFGLSFAATVGWILVAIFVGIGEECIFRGILWRALEPYGIVLTALVTSALFGAVHLVGLFAELPWQIVVSQAVFAFGVGMVFAAIRLVSGSLLAPIVLHAVFDAAAIVAAGGVNELLNDSLTPGQLLIPGAVFAFWGLCCIFVIQRRQRMNLIVDGEAV